MSQYRSSIQFNNDSIRQAVKSLSTIDTIIKKLIERKNDVKQPENEKIIDNNAIDEIKLAMMNHNYGNATQHGVKSMNSFKEAICDDINTPAALSVFLEFLNKVQKMICLKGDNFTASDATYCLSIIYSMDTIFGLFSGSYESLTTSNMKVREVIDDISTLPLSIQKLLEQRQAAKKMLNFPEADYIRVELRKLGYKVTDKQNGMHVITKIMDAAN